MNLTSEVRVYKNMEGEFSFRETIWDEDGELWGISPFAISPYGDTLKQLAEDLTKFINALKIDYIDENELEFEEDFEVEIQQGQGYVH